MKPCSPQPPTPLVTTDNYCPSTPLHAPHKNPYDVFSFSSAFQYINGLPQMSSDKSFPIPFCGLPFATPLAISTLTAYHPLLTPSLAGLEWEGEFSSQRSDRPGPSLLCSQQHEAFSYNVLGVRRHFVLLQVPGAEAVCLILFCPLPAAQK